MTGYRRRIVTTGTWLSSSNVGDNAIYCGIADTVAEAEITVISSNPERVRAIHGMKSYSPRKSPLAVLWSIAWCDFFVFTGGTPFFNDPLHMTYYWCLTLWARLFGAKVVVFGISLRSLKGYSRFMVSTIIKSAYLASAREAASLRLMKCLRGKREVHFLPDPAFQLKIDSDFSFKNFIDRFGFSGKDRFVGVCLRGFDSPGQFRKHHFSISVRDDQLERYYDAVASFSRSAIEAGHKILFIPMHVHAPDDDRIPAHLVSERLGQVMSKACAFCEDQFTPREIKALFSHLDFVLSVRFHSIVLATSVNTPVLAIEYARKNREIMKTMGMEEWSVSLLELSKDTLSSRFYDMLSKQQAIREVLTERNAENRGIYLRTVTGLFASHGNS
jgi:polysaccharide pyruvyl transferase WcaK-like protein